jgi:hypothetical protein
MKDATSRKVAGSIPDEVHGFFNWPNPSSRTVALGSTQNLTEMNILKPVSEPGYFVASWWRTQLRHPPKVTIDQ